MKGYLHLLKLNFTNRRNVELNSAERDMSEVRLTQVISVQLVNKKFLETSVLQ